MKTSQYKEIIDGYGDGISITLSNGTAMLINSHLIQFSQQVFSPSATPTKDLYRDTQIDVIAESPEMRKITQNIMKVTHCGVPVLLLGDSDTGKEVFPSILHTSSKRRYQPFIKVNYITLFPSLLAAELFGYEAGAFTGASSKGRSVLFESADKETSCSKAVNSSLKDMTISLIPRFFAQPR